MPYIDDGTGAPAAHQKLRHPLDRTLGSRQADASQRTVAQRLQAFEGQRQVATALVAGQGMDLIDDDGVHRTQAFTSRGRTHQHVQGLRGRDQNMRCLLAHGDAFFLGRITGAHRRGDGGGCVPLRLERALDALQRYLQVQTDVVGQGFQGRYVDDLRVGGQCAALLQPLAKQPVEHRQKRTERLA